MINFDKLVKVIHDSAISANQAIMDENLKLIDTYFENNSGELLVDNDDARAEGDFNEKKKTKGTLKPRTIIVEFPEQTEKGVIMKKVNVPLIALIPVSVTEVSEIRFQTDLEIMIENDGLKVGFLSKTPTSRFKRTPNQENLQTSRLEIVINPKETSKGLKSLIEGYEKVLRAQIPH
jgi:hypothetical protein